MQYLDGSSMESYSSTDKWFAYEHFRDVCRYEGIFLLNKAGDISTKTSYDVIKLGRFEKCF